MSIQRGQQQAKQPKSSKILKIDELFFFIKKLYRPFLAQKYVLDH